MSDDGWRSIAWRMYLSNTHTHTYHPYFFGFCLEKYQPNFLIFLSIAIVYAVSIEIPFFLFFRHLLFSFLFCSIFVFQSSQQFKNKKKTFRHQLVHHCFFWLFVRVVYDFVVVVVVVIGNDVISREACCELSWEHFIFLHHHHDQTLWFYLIWDFKPRFNFLLFSSFLCVCVLISRPAATDGQTLPSDVSTDQSFQPQVPSRLGIELVSWMFVNLSTGPLGPQASKLRPFFPTNHLFACLCILEFSIYIV